MRPIGTDKTYHGFVYIYDKEGNLLQHKNGEYCSQIVWEYTKGNTNGDKIKFYYPNDWLITLARSKPFIEGFCKVVSNMFQSVKYIGKFAATEIEDTLTVKKVNESFGYEYISNDKGKAILSPNSYIKNNGDLIINDIWRGFEIDISDIKNKRAMLAYSSFCLIRYLFCSHYHDVIDTFIYLRKIKDNVSYGVADFELLQLAHYSTFYSPSGSYGFFNRCVAGSGNTNSYKLKRLNEFKKAFEGSASLNGAFVGPITKIPIAEIQEHFRKQEYKKIYEKLK